MAILADTIISIGNNKSIELLKGTKTKVINAKGKFITPGFIDTHVHLMMGGNSLLNVQLRDANTPKEFTKKNCRFLQKVFLKEVGY